MTEPILDPATVQKFDDIVRAAMETGQEPIAVMARWGLLRRENEDSYEALVRAYRALEAQDGATIMQVFIGRNDGTPADMFRAVMLWFERYIESRDPKRKTGAS